MTTTLHLKENKNLLAFSEHEHSIQKTKTSIKTNGKIFPFFLCLLLYVPPAVVVFCILFSLCRILPPLKLFMYSSKSRGFFFVLSVRSLCCCCFLTTIQKYDYYFYLLILIITNKKGRVVQISCLLYHAFPTLLFFLGFLPLILFLLRNIKHCCVVSTISPASHPYNI